MNSNPFEIIETKLDRIEAMLEQMAKQKPEPKKQEPEQPIDQEEAIKFLGKSRQTLTAWRKKGIISAHKLGGRIYYLKSELLKAMVI